jgi:hypothetical protein
MKDLRPVPYRNQYEVAPRGAEIVTFVAASLAVSTLTAEIIVVVGIAVASTLVSLAVSAITSALIGKPKQQSQDLKRELRQERSLPLKRFAYGEFYAPGTPAPWKVKGDTLYGCLILNSRASDGSNVAIRIDGRDVTLDDVANLSDFTGAGAAGINGDFASHSRFWLGLGDQTTCPDDIVAEAGDIFQATDAWAGLTVLWCALKAGPSSERGSRWPQTPPAVEVNMKYSKVYDPRTAQSLDTQSGWAWSANQALATLDCMTQNPIQGYQSDDLAISDFIIAANAADDPIDLAAGGTEPRYEVNGLVVFNSNELEELLEPLHECGASRPSVIGGLASIVPGVYQEPAHTITDAIGGSLEYTDLSLGRELSNTVTVTYTSKDRNEEAAELPPYSVPGALDEDGGVVTVSRIDLPSVTSFTQAARIQKIMAYRARQQRSISLTAPPENFDMAAGDGVNLNLPSPNGIMNGEFQLRSITPALIPSDGSVAMALPVELVEEKRDAYAWTTAEEPTIPNAEPISAGVAALGAPGTITVTSIETTSGGSTVAGAQLKFAPSSSEVFDYEVEYREVGGTYQSGPTIGAAIRDGSGDVFGIVQPLEVGQAYDFRVRARTINRVSAYVETLNQTITASASSLAVPVNGVATVANNPRQINVTFAAPNDANVKGLTFYSGATSSTGAMSLFAGPLYLPPNGQITTSESGLSPGQTRFYAARSVDAFDVEGSFSAVISATTPGDER